MRSRDLPAILEFDSVIGHLFGVPASADTKEKPAVRDLIETGDGLGEIDRIVLGHQAYRRADFELRRNGRGRGQPDEGIEKFLVVHG